MNISQHDTLTYIVKLGPGRYLAADQTLLQFFSGPRCSIYPLAALKFAGSVTDQHGQNHPLDMARRAASMWTGATVVTFSMNGTEGEPVVVDEWEASTTLAVAGAPKAKRKKKAR